MSLETAKSSGDLAVGTTAVVARPAELTGILLTPAAADCSVVVYDNKSAASGTVIARVTALANTATASAFINIPVEALNGLTVVVAGAGATAIVHYKTI